MPELPPALPPSLLSSLLRSRWRWWFCWRLCAGPEMYSASSHTPPSCPPSRLSTCIATSGAATARCCFCCRHYKDCCCSAALIGSPVLSLSSLGAFNTSSYPFPPSFFPSLFCLPSSLVTPAQPRTPLLLPTCAVLPTKTTSDQILIPSLHCPLVFLQMIPFSSSFTSSSIAYMC